MLRILSAAALVVLVATGCGSSARHRVAVRGLPPALARVWSEQASAIADASAARDSCRAYQLASSLRDDVMAKEAKVPARLRAPLVAGVSALADRITCVPKPPVPPGHNKPPKHDHHHHDHHGGGGGDQGNQS